MSRWTGWWDRRSGAARIELQTRLSFHLVALMEAAEVGSCAGSADASAGLRSGLAVLALAHAALCAALSATGLDWALGRRARPVALLYAVAALTGAAALALLPLHAGGQLANGSDATVLLAGITFFGSAALYLGVRDTRAALYWVLGTAAAAGGSGAVAGLSRHAVLGNALAVLVAGLVGAFMAGCSLWLVATVWELDGARAAQSRLAVAEERLRFGRDLHDVMGRDLAVIALKSELAAELARRGRPEAVEQMVEVQRIARASQREVTDVVRGYRKADMAVELAGALSVLRAAGVEGHTEVADGSVLPPEVQAVFGWVLREATTNVLRHSEATRCTIRLTVNGPAVLAVENDGVPTEPAGATTAATTVTTIGAGSGLAGLRERLATSGGTLTTTTHAGTFHLTAAVPLPPIAKTPSAHQAGTALR